MALECTLGVSLVTLALSAYEYACPYAMQYKCDSFDRFTQSGPIHQCSRMYGLCYFEVWQPH